MRSSSGFVVGGVTTRRAMVTVMIAAVAPKGPDEFFPPTQMAQLIEIISSINASADVQTA